MSRQRSTSSQDRDSSSEPTPSSSTQRKKTWNPKGWKPSEDALLWTALDSQIRKKMDWHSTTALIPDRTHTACRDRYNTLIKVMTDPDAKRATKKSWNPKAWTSRDDAKLWTSVDVQIGKEIEWGVVEGVVGSRKGTACKDRYRVLIAKLKEAREV
ncbi:hypothetical protein HK097_008558 [Rhizophlyctis rosea]|uniref:Myb-like domain-containing protein n=1 Tax=Rhizophlyctis rosea TaxID=64517 RepID=A0AAD5X1M3_9FUNG|nr:hypothetical protein HK097_008558 [Rhizophlyctis rosea]